MSRRVLITGGAGFIGRHVAHVLLTRGRGVRILDNFHEQIHGSCDQRDPILNEVEIVEGDIRDGETVARALSGVDQVVHLAAEVGVGQSMYEVQRYVDVNETGTAVLCQKLIESPVERLVTASSMSIYGEGLYKDSNGRIVADARRRGREAESWNPAGTDGTPLTPVATPEWKHSSLSSVYALNKFAQEQMTLIVAPAYGIDAVALRLFNVFGPGQALSNPYTGVLAIFASRLLNGQPPLVFEDGEQRRDFVHVSDVAEAFALALESAEAVGEVINVGSGRDVSILQVAESIARAMGRESIEPEITHKARAGDIRHCFADIGKARKLLGFTPAADFEDGLHELAEWVLSQKADDRVGEARRELEERGLVW